MDEKVIKDSYKEIPRLIKLVLFSAGILICITGVFNGESVSDMVPRFLNTFLFTPGLYVVFAGLLRWFGSDVRIVDAYYLGLFMALISLFKGH